MTAQRAKTSRETKPRRKTRSSLKMKLAVMIAPGAVRSKRAPRVAIPVKTRTYTAIADKPDRVKNLLDSYGQASETSRLTGRPVSFRVDVDPGGMPTITHVQARAGTRAGAPDRPDVDLADALSAARARGRRRVAEILSGNDMLSADAFAELLGTTRVTVNAKRQNRQVLALEGATRGFRFPDWQIGPDGKPFGVIPDLFDRLGGDPWAVYRFLVQHHPEIDGLTGREALERGKSKQVIDVAESVGRAFS